MELNKSTVLNIFSRNFPFNIVETPLGPGVEMPARDAFIFSAVTGAGYFSNPILPFSPKGLLKLFYNAFDYNFVSGIFENTSLKNTPYNLAQAKPYLFDSAYKIVVPVEFDSEQGLQDHLSTIFDTIERPTDYLILRIERSKAGNGMESFMEYLAADYFKKIGCIVENQIPLAHALGSPDFGGYTIVEVIENLRPFIGNGFHIVELAMIRLNSEKTGNKPTKDEILRTSTIVGEAKTSTKMMTTQLIKYLDTGLFDFGFEIHPAKTEPARKDFGLFSIDTDYQIVFNPPREQYVGHNTHSKSDYEHWLGNYMKFYLMANLTNDEFDTFFVERQGRKIGGQADIVMFVCGLSIEEVITKVKGLL